MINLIRCLEAECRAHLRGDHFHVVVRYRTTTTASADVTAEVVELVVEDFATERELLGNQVLITGTNEVTVFVYLPSFLLSGKLTLVQDYITAVSVRDSRRKAVLGWSVGPK